MSTTNFHILAKPIGPICNLDCKYCFYLEKESLYPEVAKWAMRDEVLEATSANTSRRTTRRKLLSPGREANRPCWESSISARLFRDPEKIRQWQTHPATHSKPTACCSTTNRGRSFFKENEFLIGISVDGPRELHDAYRVDKGGQPTFDRVMRGLETLKCNGVEFNTLTTVHRANADHPLDVYRFLKENGSGIMQFIPDRGADFAPGHCGRSAAHLAGLQRCGQCGAVVGRAATVWPLSVRHFRRMGAQGCGHEVCAALRRLLESWMGIEPSLCVFRRKCGSALAIEHSGDLYSCDHYVYPQNRLGNIMESPLQALVNSGQQQNFGDAKETTLPRYCRECDVRFACNGECPKHRFLTTPDGEPGLNYLCAGYKIFFHHIDPYMRFMAGELAAERAPANVMRWVEAKDALVAFKQAGRNDSCPCGSIKKFKNCCGRGA